MKLKLDENLGKRGAAALRAAGHDVMTVADQDLISSADPDLIEVCRREGRGLVTLDNDFGNPLRFDPRKYHGIIVPRLPRRVTRTVLNMAISTLVEALSGADVRGKLWSIDGRRVREYQHPDREIP